MYEGTFRSAEINPRGSVLNAGEGKKNVYWTFIALTYLRVHIYILDA